MRAVRVCVVVVVVLVTGIASAGLAAAALASVPSAPSGVVPTPAGATSASVAFSPGSDGGSSVTSFTAQCRSTTGGASGSRNGPGSPLLVKGLSAGETYHCRVRATNAVGTGPWSAYSATYVQTGVPSAPSGVTATSAGPTSASVAFTPGSDGGSPVTSFTAQCKSTTGGASGSKNGLTNPLVVTGLSAGETYQCRVRATNALGAGPWSAYSSMTTTSTVTVSVVGPGSVTSVPTGINCPGGACSAPFTAAQVTLTATADSGAAFTGWSGACSGTLPTCDLSPTGDLSVTATFAVQYSLTTRVLGSGSITSAPAGISCPGTCVGIFAGQVTLTAAHGAGWVFSGWSGACAGQGAVCVVSSTTNISAIATFS